MKDIITAVVGEYQYKFDEAVMKAVANVGINVNKEELIKALELAENLVRCKDCKYVVDLKTEDGACQCDNIHCIGFRHYNDFCSYGKRKDNE